MSMQKIFDASPTIQRIKADTARSTARQYIVNALEERLGPVPEDLAMHLRTIEDQQRLDRLHNIAIKCTNMDAFRSALSE